MTGCWGPAQLTVSHVSHSVLYPTQPYSCYYNCGRPRWRGETVKLKRRVEKRKEREKKREKKEKRFGLCRFPSLTHSLPLEFFMTAGSDAHHYPTPPEIPQGTRNLHVVRFHCLNRNLWSQIDNNQSRNGDIAMKCHMESGELTSGCASQETGKSRRGLTVCFLDVNYNDHLSRVQFSHAH